MSSGPEGPDAWEALYRHVYPRLHSYARRRLAGDDQADDAVSEAMTRAIDKIDGFTWSGTRFNGWMFGILRNVVLETYRKGARHPTVDMTVMPEPTADQAQGPAATLVADEAAREVRAAFARLDPDERELLELRLVACSRWGRHRGRPHQSHLGHRADARHRGPPWRTRLPGPLRRH